MDLSSGLVKFSYEEKVILRTPLYISEFQCKTKKKIVVFGVNIFLNCLC